MSEAATFQDILAGLAAVADDGEHGLRFCFGREANDHAGVFLPWPQVARRINALTHRLAAANIGAGDVVVVHAHDQQTAMLAIFACIRRGAIPAAVAPVGSGTAARLVDQFHAIIAVAGARAVILDRDLDADITRAELPPRLIIDDFAEADDAHVAHSAQPDDPCFLQFTSGSTSVPKGVVVTHRMLLANLACMSAALDWGHEGRCVGWLPIYHDMSLVGIYCLTTRHAARACFFPTTRFGRSPDLWLRLLAEERSQFSAGPNFAFAMLNRLAERRPPTDIDLSRMRGIICGSEPIAAPVMRRFAELTAPLGLKQPVIPAFGMAECSLMATSCTPGEPLRMLVVDRRALEQEGRVVAGDPAHLDAHDGPSTAVELVGCGPAAPGMEVAVEANGVLIGDDQVGEILLAGDSVLTRYWNNAAATVAAFVDLDNQRWFRTGDLGFRHEGHYYICGRAKDVIIHNGVNYYPADVEAAVQAALPDVVRLAAIVDLRQDLAETFNGLGILFEPGKRADDVAAAEAQVQSFVKAYTGLPVAIARMLPGGEHIPRTTSGKLVRPEIRAVLRQA
jgi:fatty-acyl-CoA synthase